MTDRISLHDLHIATTLHHFIERDVLPGTGVESADFWQGFDAIVRDLAPKNAALLAERERLQSELDAWHPHFCWPKQSFWQSAPWCLFAQFFLR